ncbi:peptidase inhibitor family I36 protein [Streptomyces sp. KR80]|uniref:peptidase inhibitor family I36 protein n=1 Tax=Streptomyces sp. KR80 TaxID=3457426 RepID=UPI003FD6156C
MRHTVSTTATITVTATAAVLAAVAVIVAAAVALPLPAAAKGAPAAALRLGGCAPGQLCLWEKPEFRGVRHTYELSDIDIESCVPLPHGVTAASLANRTGRPVTTYQSAECGETGEFETYPGSGTWSPQSPYQVRAFKVWER